MNHTLHSLSLNRIYFPLLVPVLLLVGISLVTLYSIDISLFKQQLIGLVLSLGIYFIFLNIDYKIFNYFSKQLYIGILLALFLIFIIGIEAKGAVRWIDIFGLRIQFSEVLKPFFIIVLAHFLSRNASHSLGKFVTSLALLFPIFFLVLRQPDLGNAIIYFAAALCMMLCYGFPFRYFAALLGLIIVPMPLFISLLKDYQRDRIFSFFNASADPFGSSYNSIQSLISIGSGGFHGKGLGQATQSILRFLPERHTDFIFATISESFGFIGGVAILILFVFLLTQIYKIAVSAVDEFSYLTSIGIFFIILIHVFLNIGMNLAVLPIVGITLPLVSYGGSSLLTNFIMLSILSSIRSEEKKGKIFEIS